MIIIFNAIYKISIFKNFNSRWFKTFSSNNQRFKWFSFSYFFSPNGFL